MKKEQMNIETGEGNLLVSVDWSIFSKHMKSCIDDGISWKETKDQKLGFIKFPLKEQVDEEIQSFASLFQCDEEIIRLMHGGQVAEISSDLVALHVEDCLKKADRDSVFFKEPKDDCRRDYLSSWGITVCA